MRLSEMNTDQLADALCELAPLLEEIGNDENLNEYLHRLAERQKNGNMTILEKATSLVGKVVPSLLQTHREEVYKILSVLTGKTVAELRTQKGMETVREAKGCIDAELISFFI